MMKHFICKLMIVAILAVLVLPLSAASVDEASAQARAASFLKSLAHRKLMSPGASLQMAHVEKSSINADEVDFYVFNESTGLAFVIVSGEDCSEEILGYGQGSFDKDKLPCNMRYWLDEYKRQIEWLRTHEQRDAVTKTKPKRSRARLSMSNVQPLLSCQWSQGTPYCDECPIYDGQYCATGCIATAMAQVMYYWKYPEELPALSSYVTYSCAITVPALPGTRLDWDNMRDTYTYYDDYTAVQGAAVARLMRYCGQSCYMDYTPSGSGAWEEDQLAGLKLFGYSPKATCLPRDDYSDDEWNQLLMENLSQGYPVLYTGFSDEVGHAFVLDGYQDGLYHVNWGWGGSYDGYFALDAMAGSGGDGYNYGQDMHHLLRPATEEDYADSFDFEEDGIFYLENGNEATVTSRSAMLNSYSGKVIIPSTVTHDGKTYTVTSIGADAFRNSSELTEVVLPSTIKRIERFAFSYCSNLRSINIGRAVTFIGTAAFNECTALDVVNIEDLAAWCTVELENYLSSPLTNGRLFVNGQEVQDLVIPESVQQVNNDVFGMCRSLKSVTIPGSLSIIGEDAFWGCENLRSVTVNGRVDELGEFSFAYNDYLESFTVNGSVGMIGYAAMAMCPKLAEVILNDVEEFDYYAFNSCESLTAVTIPASTRNLGYASFAYCSALADVTFMSDDTSIDEATFYSCTSLTDVALPQNLTVLNDSVFTLCNHLTRVNMGDKLVSIGAGAFKNCSMLEQLALPASIRTIGPSAFLKCGQLKGVYISDISKWCGIDFANIDSNPLSLAKHLFMNGEEVTQLVVPHGVENIKKCAFYGASSLTSVSIPGSVASIGESAFKGCSGLTRVDVEDLAAWCGISFENEYSNPLSLALHLNVAGNRLEHLVVPRGVTAIQDFAFNYCDDLVDVTIGNDVTSIGKNAFMTCVNLATVTIEDGVKSIGEKAFSVCTSLTELTLGRQVEKLDKRAFSSSLLISSITCKALTPPEIVSKDCFANGVYKNASVLVPAASLEDYEGATNWNLFTNMTGEQLDFLVGDVNHDGQVNITDVNEIIDALLTGMPYDATFDVSGDGEFSIWDVNALIDLILQR